MNTTITRICKFCRYSFEYKDVQGKDILENIYNDNIIKTYFYLLNTSRYFSNVDNALYMNSCEELCKYKESIVNSFFELCDLVDSSILKETNDIDELLLKLDKYFGFVIEFPNVFDKNGFNWISYANNNSDLVAFGLTKQEDFIKHWFDYGFNENRVTNGIIGLQTSRGVLTNKYIDSLRVVYNIKHFLGEKINSVKIYDIYGEIGINAYYLHKMGVKKIEVVQKPEISLLTSYFLLNVLDKNSVTLGNESTNNNVKIISDNKILFSDIVKEKFSSFIYNNSRIEKLDVFEFDKNNNFFVVVDKNLNVLEFDKNNKFFIIVDI
jgi:hypothetical protein